jgi:hypothetical protein
MNIENTNRNQMNTYLRPTPFVKQLISEISSAEVSAPCVSIKCNTEALYYIKLQSEATFFPFYMLQGLQYWVPAVQIALNSAGTTPIAADGDVLFCFPDEV